MLVPQDIDPDDRRERAALAGALIHTRRQAGITAAELGRRLGITGRAVIGMENRITWSARTVQAWARALGHTLVIEAAGLDVPDDGDVYALTYQAALETAADPAERDKATLRLVHRDLTRARWAAGITDVEMAGRLDVTDNAVRHHDNNPDGASLIALQRYARALGGRLRLGVNTTEE